MSNPGDEIPPPDPAVEKEDGESEESAPPESFEVLNISNEQSASQPPLQQQPAGLHAPALPDGGSYPDLLEVLLEKELSIGVITLSPGEYVVITFMHLIQNRSFEARLAVVRALQKHDPLPSLISLASITEAAATEDLTTALTKLHTLELHESFNPYVHELTRRFLARRVQQIRSAYSSIRVEKLAEALGYPEPNPQIEEFLASSEWVVATDGFVEPRETPGYVQFVSNAQDPAFGVEEQKSETSEKPSQLHVDLLQRLVTYGEMLDH